MRCMFAGAGGGRELSQDPGSKTPTKAEARVVRAPHPLPCVVHFLGTQWPPQRYGLGRPMQEDRVPQVSPWLSKGRGERCRGHH